MSLDEEGTRREEVLRVETRDGARVTVARTEIRRDSLFGEDPSCRWQLALARSPGRTWCSGVAIAREDIVRAHARVPAPYRTNVAILLFGLVWCAVMVAGLELLSGARRPAQSGAKRGRAGAVARQVDMRVPRRAD